MALTRYVADAAQIGAGDTVVDVGCGYGATARLLADERGAHVTGLTLSKAQARRAAPTPGVRILVRDWLDNGLFNARFDAAIAIESLSHMPDKPKAFAELARVVKRGGRVVIVDWLTCDAPGAARRRLLLRPICEEGHLPSMHSSAEYAALLDDAGFTVDRTEDLTDRAARTWSVVARRLPVALATDERLRRRVLRSGELRFGLSLVRIPLAYRLGAMRLGLLAGVRR